MYPFQQNAPESYTPSELAEILKVKTSTIYAWISRGELQSTRTGYSRAITKAQLQNFIISRDSGKYNFALAHIR